MNVKKDGNIELTIVIVTYNCRDYLAKCLSSIKENSPSDITYEIIVVDNNSHDIDENDECLNDKMVIFTKLRTNLGFPAANNLAFQMARGRYIMMLNPDTLLIDMNLCAMLQFLELNPKLGIVAPVLLNTDGTIQASVQVFPTLLNSLASIIPYGRRGVPYWDKALATQVDSVSGACMLFRASLIREVGGLDERLFWIEDIDLCCRVQRAGFGVAVYADCKIVHYGGESAKKNPKLSLYLQLTNRSRFFMVHDKRTYGRIVYLATLLSLFARFSLYIARTVRDGDFRRISILRKIALRLIKDWTFFFGNAGRAVWPRAAIQP